jgi:PHD/YefM family antitoxin component YafN of YafNO toxin-antitoxin module
MTPTELRKNIYRVLDPIAETGKPVEIMRKGQTFKIICESSESKIERLKLKTHPKAYKGNSDEVVSMDWSAEWNPEHI